MARKLIILYLILLLISQANAQKEAYNWYFGEFSGITFNTPDGEPVGLMNGSMSTAEGCASISDNNGKLLFYTNGEKVWNKNHTPMTNGTGLSGNQYSTQSAVIIPKPGTNNIYYIFTSDSGSGANGIRYSEVDLTQSGGLGSVTTKNVFMFFPATEKIVGVRNANGKDWWLIAHEWNSDAFRTYKITNGGVAANPIFSIAGSIHNGNSENRSGYLKASLNGTKLALAIPGGKVELFDFNNSTGVISNPVKLSSLVFTGAYGIEFSGDGTKLYVSKSEIPAAIFQFDLAIWTPTGILNTQSLIAQNPNYAEFGAIQIGPNKKIYIARNNRKFLSCIANPDSMGKSCSYIDSALYLNERLSRRGLPNFNSVQVISLKISSNTPVCYGDSINLTSIYVFAATYEWTGPLGFKSALQSPSFVAVNDLQTGYYYLKMTVSDMIFLDSIFVTVRKSPVANIKLYGSQVICEGDSVLIEAVTNETNLKYIWSTGDSTKQIYAKAGKKYFVDVINSSGCLTHLDTSIGVNRVSTEIYWTGSTEICLGDSLILYALPIIPGATLLWSTGESSQSIVVHDSRKIILKITSPEGCIKYDTLDVKVHDKLDVVFVPQPDSQYCLGDTVELISNYKGPDFNYLWSTGAKTQNLKLTNSLSGWLYVYLKSGCGDTCYFNIRFSQKPKVDIIPDKAFPLCQSEILNLTAVSDLPDCKFLWSTGQTTNSIAVDSSGRYSVVVTSDSGCHVEEYIDVNFLEKPKITISGDGPSKQCEGNILKLFAVSPDSSLNFVWSTGERTGNIVVNQTGIYSVYAINELGCADTAYFEAEFYKNPSPEIISSGPLKLCRGNALTFSTKDKYANYYWNTGDTTETIVVSQEGKYWVTVIDSSGCSGLSQPVEVKLFDVNINVINLSNIKFGNVCINTNRSRTFSIINDGADAVTIDTVYIGNSGIKLSAEQPLPALLGPSAELHFIADFSPEHLGDYLDTITIKITSPCYSEMKLITTGTGIATAIFSAPDTLLPIGTHFCIPFSIRLNCGDSLNEAIAFRTKVRIESSMFFPDENQGRWVVNRYLSGSDIVFDILLTLDKLTANQMVLFDICGTILYGDFEWTDIRTDELDWNIKNISSVSLPGELAVNSMCYFDIAHIRNYYPSRIRLNNISSDEIGLSLTTEESGQFYINIFNLNGEEVSTLQFYKTGNNREELPQKIDTRELTNGYYTIIIKTPGQIIRTPIIIYK